MDRRGAPYLLMSVALAASGCRGGRDTDVVRDGGVRDAPPGIAPELHGVGVPQGAETTNALCANGLDDDDNGFADCDDFWCRDSAVVTVCAALENTLETCADGLDNPESLRPATTPEGDGLIDCADPDCIKNPGVPSVCPALRYETGDLCDNGADDDGDTAVDCEDLDCLHAGASSCATGARRRVLFDDAHRERAGTADWVVDTSGAHPWPSLPVSEDDWAGTLSSFGVALVQSGRFTVETLPATGGHLTFGDPANPQDLSLYAVLVIVEPSAPFSDQEAQAVLEFVEHGGGLLAVADHYNSDRDGNDWDSVLAWNDLLRAVSAGALEDNPFGFSVREVSYDESGAIDDASGERTSTIDPAGAGHQVLDGANGQVTSIGIHRGGLFDVHSDANATAIALIHALPLESGGYPESPYVVASEVGLGRVVAAGDSAILDDSTDSHGVTSYHDSWNDSDVDNDVLFLNAVDWLAFEASTSGR